MVKKRISPYFSHKEVINDYLAFISKGLINKIDDELLGKNFSKKESIVQLSLGGMYICHTPCDGDILAVPVINNGKIYSNPFYDVDLIEFCLGVPFRYRFGISVKESRILFSLEKRIFRKLAENFLPKNLVYRKKGLTLPISTRSDLSENLPKTLSNSWHSSLN